MLTKSCEDFLGKGMPKKLIYLHDLALMTINSFDLFENQLSIWVELHHGVDDLNYLSGG